MRIKRNFLFRIEKIHKEMWKLFRVFSFRHGRDQQTSIRKFYSCFHFYLNVLHIHSLIHKGI